MCWDVISRAAFCWSHTIRTMVVPECEEARELILHVPCTVRAFACVVVHKMFGDTGSELLSWTVTDRLSVIYLDHTHKCFWSHQHKVAKWDDMMMVMMSWLGWHSCGSFSLCVCVCVCVCVHVHVYVWSSLSLTCQFLCQFIRSAEGLNSGLLEFYCKWFVIVGMCYSLSLLQQVCASNSVHMSHFRTLWL